MEAVTIWDYERRGDRRCLAFDLADILRLAEQKIASSYWTCRDVRCSGEPTQEFEHLGVTEEIFNGSELLRLASGVHQVIDGEFRGFCPGHARPWAVIVSHDSTLYAVITDDKQFLASISARFEDVRAAPDWATEYA